MSVDEVATLRAAGLEAAAKVIEAARAGQVAAQPSATPVAPAAAPAPPASPEIPSAEVPAAAVGAATPAAGQEFTLADYDRMSPDKQREFALTDEGDAAITAALRREG
jgi:hypothetical protein